MKKFVKYPTSYVKASITSSGTDKLVIDAINNYLNESGEVGFIDESKNVYLFAQDEYICNGTISDATKKLNQMIKSDPELLDNTEDVQDAVIYDCVKHSRMSQDKFVALCYKYGHAEVAADYE